MNAPAPVDVYDYVREAFDGVVADELDPMDYFADVKGANEQQGNALKVIEAELVRRYGRALMTGEIIKLGIAIASEWQTRRVKAQEAAFERSEGRMQNNAERPYAENH